jgi:hypothetical protein
VHGRRKGVSGLFELVAQKALTSRIAIPDMSHVAAITAGLGGKPKKCC